MYLQKYKVRGFGYFPIDMLRYDQAFPLYESESAKIINNVRNTDILLGRYVNEGSEPCYGRWESFGWKVTELVEE